MTRKRVMCASLKKTIRERGPTGQSASLQSLGNHGVSALGLTKEEEVTGKSQHGFIKSKSCLTNPIAFSCSMMGFMHKGKGMDII